MASASPMASQLKSSFTSPITTRPALLSPKGLSTSPFWLFPSKRLSSFPIKAVQSDKQNFQVVQPINGFIGSLETPVTSSPLIAWYLSNLLAYRTAVSPLLRVIEIISPLRQLNQEAETGGPTALMELFPSSDKAKAAVPSCLSG